MERAVIVAAGLSSRIQEVTGGMPKGLLTIRGQSILRRSLDMLEKAGVRQSALVVGYEKHQLAEALGSGPVYLSNPFYRQCNNMASLWFAREFVGSRPFLYLHGDLVYDEKILSAAVKSYETSGNEFELVTDFIKPDAEAMKVKVNSSRYLIRSDKEIPEAEADGEWTGIAVIRNPRALFSCIEELLFEGRLNDYDTAAFTALARKGHSLFCVSTQGAPWIEIDDPGDYEKAKGLFE